MGKAVQVNAGFFDVQLPPSGRPFNAGATTTLTDAEYAALPQATLRALTVTNGSVADPTRSNTNPPASLQDAVNQAEAYSNVSVVKTVTGTTQTLDKSVKLWVFTGSVATTWTLPSALSNVGVNFRIYNRGSAAITLNGTLYSGGSTVSTVTVAAGASSRVESDGTYWLAS